jgi:hypothetical protein
MALQDHPEKFPDGASMSSGTKRLGIIVEPCGFSKSHQPGEQIVRRCLVAQPDAVPIRSLDKIPVALIDREQRRWRAMTGTEHERIMVFHRRVSIGANLPFGSAARSTVSQARSSAATGKSASAQPRHTPQQLAVDGRAVAGAASSTKPTCSRSTSH